MSKPSGQYSEKIALGEVPQGYTLNRIPAGAAVPSCAHPGVKVDFSKGQYMMGHHLNVVFIGVALNVSDQPIEFKEALCKNWDVAAVTTWPLNVLEPGRKGGDLCGEEAEAWSRTNV